MKRSIKSIVAATAAVFMCAVPTIASVANLPAANSITASAYYTPNAFADFEDSWTPEVTGLTNFGAPINLGHVDYQLDQSAKTATINWRRGSDGAGPMGTNAYGALIAGGARGYAWGINAAAPLGKNVDLYLGYDKFDDKDLDNSDNGIFDVGLTGKFGDFKLDAVYLRANNDLRWAATGSELKNSGVVVTASYKGANFKKAGTWGVEAKYYNQGAGTYVAHTMNGTIPAGNGFKGYKLAAYYAVAKGMVAGIEWYDLKAKEGDNKSKTLWTALNFAF